MKGDTGHARQLSSFFYVLRRRAVWTEWALWFCIFNFGSFWICCEENGGWLRDHRIKAHRLFGRPKEKNRLFLFFFCQERGKVTGKSLGGCILIDNVKKQWQWIQLWCIVATLLRHAKFRALPLTCFFFRSAFQMSFVSGFFFFLFHSLLWAHLRSGSSSAWHFQRWAQCATLL